MADDKVKQEANEKHGKAAVAAVQAAEPKRPGRQRERGEEVTNELPAWWNSPDNELKEGDELEGFYRGWKLISPASADKPFKIFYIEDEETGEISSFSGAIASRLMSRVPRDCYCWITYLGKKKTGKRNAMTHLFKVELPKGVSPLPETLTTDADLAAE